jgi:hypothetical protein
MFKRDSIEFLNPGSTDNLPDFEWSLFLVELIVLLLDNPSHCFIRNKLEGVSLYNDYIIQLWSGLAHIDKLYMGQNIKTSRTESFVLYQTDFYLTL